MEHETYGLYDSAQKLVTLSLESIEKNVKSNQDNPDSITIPLSDGEILALAPGDLIVLSGAIKSGKTTVALDMARQLGIGKNCPVGYFTPGPLEYSDLGKRFISLESQITLHKIESGILSVDDLQAIQDASKKLYESPLFFSQTPNVSFEELESTARMLAEDKKVKVIFIDSLEYLQKLVDADPELYRYELEALLDQIKTMAVNLNISVVLVAGFSIDYSFRPASIRNFKKHIVIPRKADTVLILNRQQPNDKGITEILLRAPKYAHGSTFVAGMSFKF